MLHARKMIIGTLLVIELEIDMIARIPDVLDGRGTDTLDAHLCIVFGIDLATSNWMKIQLN